MRYYSVKRIITCRVRPARSRDTVSVFLVAGFVRIFSITSSIGRSSVEVSSDARHYRYSIVGFYFFVHFFFSAIILSSLLFYLVYRYLCVVLVASEAFFLKLFLWDKHRRQSKNTMRMLVFSDRVSILGRGGFFRYRVREPPKHNVFFAFSCFLSLLPVTT